MKRVLFAIVMVLFLAACGDDSAPAEKSSIADESTSAVVFRSLDLQTEDNSFQLTGEVRAIDQAFYFQIEQGEEQIQEEEIYELEQNPGSWESFEITGEIPAEAADQEGTPILMMYGKSAEGEILHPNYLPIDIKRADRR